MLFLGIKIQFLEKIVNRNFLFKNKIVNRNFLFVNQFNLNQPIFGEKNIFITVKMEKQLSKAGLQN